MNEKHRTNCDLLIDQFGEEGDASTLFRPLASLGTSFEACITVSTVGITIRLNSASPTEEVSIKMQYLTFATLFLSIFSLHSTSIKSCGSDNTHQILLHPPLFASTFFFNFSRISFFITEYDAISLTHTLMRARKKILDLAYVKLGTSGHWLGARTGAGVTTTV